MSWKSLWTGVAVFLGAAVLSFALQVDPFYQQSLAEGERLLEAGNYADAALALEVAVFGLRGDRPQQIKALGYFVLAAYKAGQAEKSRDGARRFLRLVGEDPLETLPLKEEWREELLKLISYFHKSPDTKPPARTEKPPPAKEEKTPLEERPPDQTPSPSRADLAARSYGLFDQYLQQNQTAAARRVLESLLRQEPSEVRAVHLLGKLDFREEKFKSARSRFEKVVDEETRLGDRDGLLTEATAYLVLCAYHLEGGRAARVLSHSLRSRLEGEAFDRLGLEGVEMQLIRDFLRGSPEAEPEKRTLETVTVQDTVEGLRLEVVCSPPTTYRTFALRGDKKIVLDLYNVDLIAAARSLPVKKRGVKTIRTGLFQKNTARLVLDLEGEIPSYEVRETETGLVVLVR